MAEIIGAVGTSHVPAIGGAIARRVEDEPYWRPFFKAFPKVRRWLAEARPDTVVMFYNDHGLNFFLDKMPTFAVGAAGEYRNADEGWGLPVQHPLHGDPELSWHVIETLTADGFDLTTCQEMQVDHAVVVPMQLLWPGERPVRLIPVAINTVQHPLPSAARCLALGRSVGRAVATYGGDSRVLVVGSGGLSHQLDGARAGFINRVFDEMCLQALVDGPEVLTRYSTAELVELAGTQGVEILNWIAMRGALSGRIGVVAKNYHIPISNTATGVLALETG